MDRERSEEKSGRRIYLLPLSILRCHWLPAFSIFVGNYVAGVYPGAEARRNINSPIVEVENILSPNGKGLLYTKMQSLSANIRGFKVRESWVQKENFLAVCDLGLTLGSTCGSREHKEEDLALIASRLECTAR